jgi:hypothetical protein|tara:strand:+ start:529 stop:798 length:270 start_codon:yes stop_codon:yes gene_type:complete
MKFSSSPAKAGDGEEKDPNKKHRRPKKNKRCNLLFSNLYPEAMGAPGSGHFMCFIEVQVSESGAQYKRNCLYHEILKTKEIFFRLGVSF